MANASLWPFKSLNFYKMHFVQAFMLYNEDFNMCRYVGFSQIKSLTYTHNTI